MKTLVSLSLALVLALAGALILFNPSGAGENGSSKDTPVFSIVPIQNSCNAHVSSSGVLKELIDTINITGGEIHITLPSSKPETLYSGEGENIDPIDASDQTRLRGRLEHTTGPLAPLFSIETALPSSPEIDLVESLRTAAAPLNTQSVLASGRERYLYVYGAGIDTANQKLSFLKGILQSDYYAVIDEMASLDVLPNLEGVTVMWVGIAQTTAEPQQSVPYEYVETIKSLWRYFLEQCGAASITFKDASVIGEANTVESGYPSVTPVPWPPTESGGWVFNEYISLTENVLGFNAEEASYRDVDGVSGNEVARQVLAPYASALARTGQTILICGSAWDIGDGDRRELSLMRAARVRDDLIALGVPAEQLLVIGCGNLGTDIRIGNKIVNFYLPGEPETSRAIHFVPVDNGMADDLLARFGPAV